MRVSLIRVIDAASTQVAVTVGDAEWVGIPCHSVGGTIAIDADGEIANAAKEWLATGGTPTMFGAVPPSKAELYAYAADKRYRVITGGIVFNGVPIGTTDEYVTRIKNKRDLIRDGQAATPFKMVIGSITIDATLDLMNALVKAVGDYWQSGFDVQASVNDQIASGAITTYAQIDAAAWPS